MFIKKTFLRALQPSLNF